MSTMLFTTRYKTIKEAAAEIKTIINDYHNNKIEEPELEEKLLYLIVMQPQIANSNTFCELVGKRNMIIMHKIKNTMRSICLETKGVKIT